MAIDYPTLSVATKALSSSLRWETRHVDKIDDGLAAVTPLEIDGVTIQGFRFRVTARKSLPMECVAFQIDHHGPHGAGGAMCRIEWRPLKGHNNKGIGPQNLRNLLMRGSHHHSFDLNWQFASAKLRRGQLPVAEPITTSLETWNDLLAFVSQEFRIDNLNLEPPPWQATLL